MTRYRIGFLDESGKLQEVDPNTGLDAVIEYVSRKEAAFAYEKKEETQTVFLMPEEVEELIENIAKKVLKWEGDDHAALKENIKKLRDFLTEGERKEYDEKIENLLPAHSRYMVYDKADEIEAAEYGPKDGPKKDVPKVIFEFSKRNTKKNEALNELFFSYKLTYIYNGELRKELGTREDIGEVFWAMQGNGLYENPQIFFNDITEFRLCTPEQTAEILKDADQLMRLLPEEIRNSMKRVMGQKNPQNPRDGR